MVSKQKLFMKLDMLEAELEERLVPHLEQAAIGNNDLVFCATGFNPHKELKSSTDRETEELIALGGQILSLRSKLGEPSEGSIAARICWYCREWGSLEKDNRNNVPVLARQFLDEIGTQPGIA